MSAPSSSVPPPWEQVPLGELLDLSNGLNADKSAYGAGVPFANVLEIITHESITESDTPGRVVVNPKALRRYEVKQGDVLFNRTSETQEDVGLASVFLGARPIVFGGFVFRGRPLTRRLTLAYSKYAFRSPHVRRQIISRGQGGIRANIGQRDLKNVMVCLPSRAEQAAIAERLDDVSAAAACLERLVAKKEAVKQGIMQQLLTGKTRLPGFCAAWVHAALGEVATVNMGQSPIGSSYNNTGRGWPLVQGNADIKQRRTIDRLWTTRPTKRCRAGDVILTVRAPVGHTAIAQRDSCIGRGVCSLAAEHDNRFLFHALVYNESRWVIYEQGSTFTAVNSDEVRSFTVPWPVDAIERRAIATLLDDVDDEIRVLQDRLVKGRHVKQAMMQELLTGRTRLPVADDVE